MRLSARAIKSHHPIKGASANAAPRIFYREAEKAQSFSAPVLDIFRLTALYFRPNRAAKKACQTRKDGFLSQGA